MQTAHLLEKNITLPFRMGYLLYLPPDYDRSADSKWPLVLFLHGAGESGTNIELVKKHGPPKLVAAGKDFPFILVSPQCNNSAWHPHQLAALLDDIEASYRVDLDRVYVTGLSMGGFGTWSLAAEYPKRFAAIAPICGGGPIWAGDRLKDMPIWAFHGALDDIVVPDRTHEMVHAVQAAGGNAKVTIYPDADHDSWTCTYDNPELYEWLLHHKRTSSAFTSNGS